MELGQNTKIQPADLLQTETGARRSRISLAWGRIRAFLAPGHQKEGSHFDIETPKAQVGVKFSQPDVEVSYDLNAKISVARLYDANQHQESCHWRRNHHPAKGAAGAYL